MGTQSQKPGRLWFNDTMGGEGFKLFYAESISWFNSNFYWLPHSIIYRVNRGKVVFYRLPFFAEISFIFEKTWSYFQENFINF